ncbi:MAG: ABC transporter substrate-binding protein [Hornefia sp.]|nr:ABC transporter substrate-binding protein [Hornefia sp.]
MKLLRVEKTYKIIAVCGFVLLSFMATLLLTGCQREDEKEVHVFCYGDYMDPSIPKDFEKETGIKVILDTFDTNEQLYPVIKNRAGVYDVICISDYMAERMKNENLLGEIDKKQLKHYKNLDKEYLKLADRSFDRGNKYAVPYQWGTVGILYNKKRVDARDVQSWKALWNGKYKGKILMQDSLRDTMGIALKALGYSLNSADGKKLSEAANYLSRQKPLVYKYANDSARDLLIGNSADLGVVWNGEAIYSKELNKDLEFAVPKEGTEIFVDSWCIPRNAFHRENAHMFIDYMCRKEAAYRNFKYLKYSTPNKAARSLMTEKYKNNPVIFPSKEILDRSEALRDVGPDGDDLYSKYWKIFKSH